MKRLLALAAVLALAIGLVWMRTSTPAATQSAPVEARKSTAEAVAAPRLEAPETAALDRLASTPEPAAPARSAASTRAPIVLTGRLTDASGKEFRTLRGQMRITDAHGLAQMAPIDGDTYSVDGVAPGAIDIGVEAAGFRRVARAVTLDAQELEHREDFALEPIWTIAVRIVTTDGRAFPDPGLAPELPQGARLWAVATEAPPGERVPPDLAEFFGWKYWTPRENKECFGMLDIAGKPPMYVSAVVGDTVVATRLLETSVEAITIEIALDRLRAIGCSVQGSVVDATTLAPVPGAQVVLLGPSGNLSMTDAAGAFIATRMLAGDYTISIQTPDHAHDLRRVRLTLGHVHDLGAIPIQARVPLRGRFADPQGRAVSVDADLVPFDPEFPLARPRTSRNSIVVRSDSSGRFETENCGRGVYVLSVPSFGNRGADRSGWWNSPMLVDLRNGPIDDLVVPVHVGVELVLRPADEGVRQLPYSIVVPGGMVATWGHFADSGVVRKWLAPGSYSLLLGGQAAIVRQIPFTLGEESMTLDVRL